LNGSTRKTGEALRDRFSCMKEKKRRATRRLSTKREEGVGNLSTRRRKSSRIHRSAKTKRDQESRVQDGALV